MAQHLQSGGDDDDQPKTNEEDEEGEPLAGDYHADERIGEGHDPDEKNVT